MEEQQVVENKEPEVANVEVVEEKKVPLELSAAQFLHGALPAFRRDMGVVTGTQVKRVLAALVEHPLEETAPAFSNEKAFRLYELGLHITNAKFILFMTGIYDSISKELKNELNVEVSVEQLRTFVQKGKESNVSKQGEKNG